MRFVYVYIIYIYINKHAQRIMSPEKYTLPALSWEGEVAERSCFHDSHPLKSALSVPGQVKMPGKKGKPVNLLRCFLLANCPSLLYLYWLSTKHFARLKTGKYM